MNNQKEKGGDGVSKVNMETLLPFIEEAFNRNLDFEIPVTGTSMNPLLMDEFRFWKDSLDSFGHKTCEGIENRGHTPLPQE